MVTYRTQIKIVADVLYAAKDNHYESEGVGISVILRKANISYSRLANLLSELVSSGLLFEIPQTRGSRYRISGQGIQFLHEYSKFEEFTEAFGLRL
tara:strand:- start:304 stop:591 length:288 start_codon:yes stop_codon:yes gene_type:complete